MINRSLSRNGMPANQATETAPVRKLSPASAVADPPARTCCDSPEGVWLEEGDSPPCVNRRVDWQMVALWVFVVACFALFLFAAWLIRAKFQGVAVF